jgi:hypothetical protein
MDDSIIAELKLLCDFSYRMEDNNCVEISFFDEKTIFEGTIRHHPEKKKILSLVAKLHQLRKLNLRKCKIGTINLDTPFLEYLDLSCNDLSVVPDWVYSLNLKYLSLGSNQLTEIKSIPNYIETLKLHKNKIKFLPQLPQSLRFLNLYLNEMDFPSDLPSLEFLSFGVTNLTLLPSLPKSLKWLSLVVNKIQALPDDFCQMVNLEGIRLAKNEINHLPEDIGTMRIKELTLYSNNLNRLPESFYNLNLRKLNLSKNPLLETDAEKARKRFEHIDFFELQ